MKATISHASTYSKMFNSTLISFFATYIDDALNVGNEEHSNECQKMEKCLNVNIKNEALLCLLVIILSLRLDLNILSKKIFVHAWIHLSEL